jgi:hypothetical protein
MSQENVEIVKRLKAAFNEKDLEAFAALTTPDFEWTTSMMAVEGEVFWGREGIEKYFERMREVWEEFRGFAREYRDLGEWGSGGWWGGGGAAAYRSMLRSPSYTTFATERSRECTPTSITARRCGRLACPGRRVGRAGR